jgi:hypothetical protein
LCVLFLIKENQVLLHKKEGLSPKQQHSNIRKTSYKKIPMFACVKNCHYASSNLLRIRSNIHPFEYCAKEHPFTDRAERPYLQSIDTPTIKLVLNILSREQSICVFSWDMIKLVLNILSREHSIIPCVYFHETCGRRFGARMFFYDLFQQYWASIIAMRPHVIESNFSSDF